MAVLNPVSPGGNTQLGQCRSVLSHSCTAQVFSGRQVGGIQVLQLVDILWAWHSDRLVSGGQPNTNLMDFLSSWPNSKATSVQPVDSSTDVRYDIRTRARSNPSHANGEWQAVTTGWLLLYQPSTLGVQCGDMSSLNAEEAADHGKELALEVSPLGWLAPLEAPQTRRTCQPPGTPPSLILPVREPHMLLATW